jgi:pSer/pThr/pTyr-binding forkhead associated (FHA) protein
MMDQDNAQLLVEAGPDSGRRIVVPPAGGRIGRSSQNDIELTDPSVSRFQCRVFFKPDGLLWVADLGSTNETLLNGAGVMESRLKPGDVIEIGETRIRVLRDQLAAPAPAEAAAPDLGLHPDRAPAPSASGPARWLWLIAVLAVGALALAALRAHLNRTTDQAADSATRLPLLDVVYEKVDASPANIFRYELRLSDATLAVRLDSLEEGRHLNRDKQVDPETLRSLISDLDRSGFFDLQPIYEGLAPEVYDAKDLTITVGARSRRVQVVNRNEPDAFKTARELLENFARSELGLGAVALPPEKLLELARDATQLGQKLFAEREVRYENLSRAIRAFEEAQWYLETIEPKPDYYPTAVSGLAESQRQLQQRVDDARFQADRAVKLRDWDTAARQLRMICELVPDRGDERHGEAQRQLLDVERRLKR